MPGTRGAPVGLSLYAPAPDAPAFYAPELYAPVPARAPLAEPVDEVTVAPMAESEPPPTGLDGAGEDWYHDAAAIANEVAQEAAARPLSEPEQDLFAAAVRDLPMYMPENVDVSRWTPRANAVIAASLDVVPPIEMRESGAFELQALTGAADASRDALDAAPSASAADLPSVETDTADWRASSALPRAGSRAESVAAPDQREAPIGAVPAEGNRRVAAALEEVAEQIRRGALVVGGTVPASSDPQALAAALAAALGALLGVVR